MGQTVGAAHISRVAKWGGGVCHPSDSTLSVLASEGNSTFKSDKKETARASQIEQEVKALALHKAKLDSIHSPT